MTAVRSSMGQSKIEVFRRILGDEAAARKANEAFEDHYAAAVRGGAISAVPGAEDTIMRLRDAGVRVCLATGFSPVTRDAIIDELAWGGLIDLALSPADAGRGRPWPDLPLTALLRLRGGAVGELAVAGDTASDIESGPPGRSRDRGRRADRRQHPRRPRAGRRPAHPRHDRGHPPLHRQLTRRAATSTGWAGATPRRLPPWRALLAKCPPKPQSPRAGTKMPILARQVGMMASQDKREVASSWRAGIGW